MKIEDIFFIVRGYDRYKEMYRPGVIDSISHGTDGVKDLFSMRLVNKSVLANRLPIPTAKLPISEWMIGTGTVSLIRLTSRKSIKFGTPQQQTLPEDHGTGLIWRLSSITRLEERDGGVYAELEAIALSRDIPAAFRLFVTPIVRLVWRDSLATALHQTKIAIDVGMAAHRAQERPAR
ncbi:MAG: hypothetical protein ACJ74Z_22325 [Bryobacteraceae bacterium]